MSKSYISNEAYELCRDYQLFPEQYPCNDGHHTDAEMICEDVDLGNLLGYFLGGLFVDVEDDPTYIESKMTSTDAWSRVARALRIHGLKIVNDQGRERRNGK